MAASFSSSSSAREAKDRAARSASIATLGRNPIEIWCQADFERPLSLRRSFLGLRAAAPDPAGVRRVFLDNSANYRKDAVQLRVLRPGLGDRLLTAEGERWRRSAARSRAVFSPRQVAAFAPAMHRVAQAAVEPVAVGATAPWSDVGEMASRMTLKVLEQTLFSQGLGRARAPFQQAVTRYFDTFGRHRPARPARRAGLPAAHRPHARTACARLLRRRRRRHRRSRKALLDRGATPPGDLLTLLLAPTIPRPASA